jgi:hypothetical protein
MKSLLTIVILLVCQVAAAAESEGYRERDCRVSVERTRRTPAGTEYRVTGPERKLLRVASRFDRRWERVGDEDSYSATRPALTAFAKSHGYLLFRVSDAEALHFLDSLVD